MQGVNIVDHPLVQHKLTLIRDKSRSTKSFRELLKEIGMLLCYEVTRDLPLTSVEIETPLAKMMAPRLAGKKLVFAPILRSGITFAEGMLDLVPAARVAHIGLYREPETFTAVEYSSSADRSQRAAGDRGRAGPGHRQHRGGRGGPFEGARRQGYQAGDADLRSARHRAHARHASRRDDLDRGDRRDAR